MVNRLRIMRLAALILTPILSFAMDKIVIDTDCGFFGDDGSALIMVLRSPEKVQVSGISVVSGNVWAAESAAYVREIVKLAGRPALQPYIGAQMPLIHTPELAKLESGLEFQGAFATPIKTLPAANPSAMNFLAGAIQSNPGEITILALGPMTNVAMLL